MKKIVLVSGGLDSVLTMHKIKDGIPLFIDYGQPEVEHELKAVLELWPCVERIQIKSQVEKRQGVYYPARNLFLATCAVMFKGADQVWMGGMQDDNCIDKTPAAFEAMSQILTQQAGRKIEVLSPFWEVDKADAIANYLGKGGDKEKLLMAFSCYRPTEQGKCKDCEACFRFSCALTVNGMLKRTFIPTVRVQDEYLEKLHQYSESRRWTILSASKQWGRKIVVCDIDGVLTNETEGHDYANRTAKMTKISPTEDVVLILYSSRRESDRDVTMKWLKNNKINYHSLILNKMPTDRLVDDLAETHL